MKSADSRVFQDLSSPAALIRFGSAAALLALLFGCRAGQAPPASAESGKSKVEEQRSPLLDRLKTPLPPELEVTDRVEVQTSMGAFVIDLFGKAAPKTAANFLSYVDRGFYSGKIFHRVIAGFMIQTGGFDAELNRATADPPIRLEIIPGLKHVPGTVSMARTSDPHSASSQFFICVTEALQLNGTYAAFGKVSKGYDVVEAISLVPTKTADTPQGTMNDVPATPVRIVSMTRLTVQPR